MDRTKLTQTGSGSGPKPAVYPYSGPVEKQYPGKSSQWTRAPGRLRLAPENFPSELWWTHAVKLSRLWDEHYAMNYIEFESLAS